MKIIQIAIDSIKNKRPVSERIIGLSSEGKIYVWKRKELAKDKKRGWIEIKDEINFCKCGNSKDPSTSICKDCFDQEQDLIEEEKIDADSKK